MAPVSPITGAVAGVRTSSRALLASQPCGWRLGRACTSPPLTAQWLRGGLVILTSRECETTSELFNNLPMKALLTRIETVHELADVGFISPLSHGASRRIILHMTLRNSVPDTFTLTGDDKSGLTQLLELPRHQARVAQTAAAPRMQDALTELEDALADRIAALSNAAEDDQADSEALGDPGRSWRPLRAA